MSKYKYLILLTVLCIAPTIVVHTLLIPLWNGNISMSTNAAKYSFMLTAFVVPIYSVIISYFMNLQFKIFNLLLIACVVTLNIFLSSYLSIYNWENATSHIYNTNDESQGVINLERIIGLIIAGIGILILYFTNKLKYKN